MTTFGIRKELRATYDQALASVPEALKSEGFGVLTEIDIQSTLKQKLGVDFRRYKILGACNPPFAHEALQEDLAAGLLLPCNVVVYEGRIGARWSWRLPPRKPSPRPATRSSRSSRRR